MEAGGACAAAPRPWPGGGAFVKQVMVDEAGGCCLLCGYDRCVAALAFHHLDPASKSFTLGQAGVTRSIARTREEAQKCVLFCANCHAEVEAGVAGVP